MCMFAIVTAELLLWTIQFPYLEQKTSAATACSNDTSEIMGQLVKMSSTVTQRGFGESPAHNSTQERKHRKAINSNEKTESYR